MSTINIPQVLLDSNREHQTRLVNLLIENPEHKLKALIDSTLIELKSFEAKYVAELQLQQTIVAHQFESSADVHQALHTIMEQIQDRYPHWGLEAVSIEADLQFENKYNITFDDAEMSFDN